MGQPIERKRLVVSFASIEVRVYPIILGDNPSVEAGAPVTIDWDFTDSGVTSVHKFEKDRRFSRRNQEDLQLSPYQRSTILRRAGYSRTEIHRVIKDVKNTQRQRKASLTRSETTMGQLLGLAQKSLEDAKLAITGSTDKKRKTVSPLGSIPSTKDCIRRQRT